MPLIEESKTDLKVSFLFFEKKIKNKKKKIATIPNLSEREIKGVALLIIISLVINADDHSITKTKGKIL